MEFYSNHLSSVAMTPSEYYESQNQAIVDSLWEDTDRIYKIKEQRGLPFRNEWCEYEAWLSTVSDNSINMNKSVSDFIQVLFKDNDHKANFKGQYYKICLDGEHEEDYICYDKMNKLSQLSDFKVVRCNQTLTWVNSKNGNIVTMPCYIGYDISSTNNQYAKTGTIPNVRMVIYVQANEETLSIQENKRLMFSHRQCYKVEQVEDYEYEQFTDNEITFVKLYIAYSPLLPTDNTELNLCDYYSYDYEINIDNDETIEQPQGYTKQLSATVTLHNEVVDLPIIWETENDKVATVSEDGLLTILGNVGDKTVVKARISGNETFYDSIDIIVAEEVKIDSRLSVAPYSHIRILMGDSQEYTVGVYNNGTLTDAEITCVANWTDNKYYTLDRVDNNKFVVTNNKQTSKELILTFSAENVDPISVSIKLGGMF
jgi:hypothetical protein